jgi:prepilin-type N-terminal cleavage/methylation domain-containing protein
MGRILVGIRAAFTMLEVMVVVTIIAILAAVVVPRFGGLTDDARSSAALTSVGGVRTSMAAYRTRRVIAGESPFPTIEDLVAEGTVMQNGMPANPYSGLNSVQEVSEAQADARTVSAPEMYGWCYFVDNESEPARAVIYLNSDAETRVPSPSGGYRTANEL